MHRIDSAGISVGLPTPASAGTPGYFTAGNPTTGTPATVIGADWLNAIQEELVAVVVAGGLSLDKTNRGQLLAAARALFGGAGSLGAAGYKPLGLGLILQWGGATFPASGTNSSSVTVTLPLAWPVGLYAGVVGARGGANSSAGALPSAGVTGSTTTQLTLSADALGYSVFNQTCAAYWLAVGH